MIPSPTCDGDDPNSVNQHFLLMSHDRLMNSRAHANAIHEAMSNEFGSCDFLHVRTKQLI